MPHGLGPEVNEVDQDVILVFRQRTPVLAFKLDKPTLPSRPLPQPFFLGAGSPPAISRIHETIATHLSSLCHGSPLWCRKIVIIQAQPSTPVELSMPWRKAIERSGRTGL